MADRFCGDDVDILKCHAAHPRLWIGLVLVEKVDHKRRCFIIRIHPRRVSDPADPNPSECNVVNQAARDLQARKQVVSFECFAR